MTSPSVLLVVFVIFWAAGIFYLLRERRSIARRHGLDAKALYGIFSNPFAYPPSIMELVAVKSGLKADIDHLYKVMYVQMIISAILLAALMYVGAHSAR